MTLGILLLFIAPKKIKNYAMKIKSDCLSKLLKVFGDIQWQNGKNIINDWDLNRSALFPILIPDIQMMNFPEALMACRLRFVKQICFK